MLYLPKLAELRKLSGLSQTDVANRLMIPQQQYSRYETGKNEIPVRYLIELSEFYSVKVDVLLESWIDTQKQPNVYDLIEPDKIIFAKKISNKEKLG